jgi:putative oxidoreductase
VKRISLISAIIIIVTSCVQSTRPRVVVMTLDVAGMGPVKSVGVRGEGNPLSWKEDKPLTAIVPDSLYTLTVTGHTPYDFTEIKFTVNGQFELENKANRRLVFTGDTTYYKATFNIE